MLRKKKHDNGPPSWAVSLFLLAASLSAWFLYIQPRLLDWQGLFGH
jgi:hypothetical protein